MIHIGDEITKIIDYKPLLLLKNRYIRGKYPIKSYLEESTRNLLLSLTRPSKFLFFVKKGLFRFGVKKGH